MEDNQNERLVMWHEVVQSSEQILIAPAIGASSPLRHGRTRYLVI